MKKDNTLLYIGAAAVILYFLLKKKNAGSTPMAKKTDGSGNVSYMAAGGSVTARQKKKINAEVKKEVDLLKFNVMPDEWASEENQYQTDINTCKI